MYICTMTTPEMPNKVPQQVAERPLLVSLARIPLVLARFVYNAVRKREERNLRKEFHTLFGSP